MCVCVCVYRSPALAVRIMCGEGKHVFLLHIYSGCLFLSFANHHPRLTMPILSEGNKDAAPMECVTWNCRSETRTVFFSLFCFSFPPPLDADFSFFSLSLLPYFFIERVMSVCRLQGSMTLKLRMFLVLLALVIVSPFSIFFSFSS